jgi:hypothetical protein
LGFVILDTIRMLSLDIGIGHSWSLMLMISNVSGFCVLFCVLRTDDYCLRDGLMIHHKTGKLIIPNIVIIITVSVVSVITIIIVSVIVSIISTRHSCSGAIFIAVATTSIGYWIIVAVRKDDLTILFIIRSQGFNSLDY